jgi:hypothetical protein
VLLFNGFKVPRIWDDLVAHYAAASKSGSVYLGGSLPSRPFTVTWKLLTKPLVRGSIGRMYQNDQNSSG